jgi:hypothetical protein
MSVNKIFEDLAATASRLEKEAILSKHKNNDDLKLAVKLALDPLINFYIRKIPDYTPNTNNLGDNLDWAMEQLVDMLASREVTGNSAIEHLQYVLESVGADDALVIERIIKKDLRCGVSEATANKIWPELVHSYPVMLCSQYEQKNVDKIKFPALVQLKMDGMRFNAIVNNGKVSYYSRNGKLLDLMGKPDEDFIQAARGENVVFDGELWIADKNEAPLPRQTGNGILAKCQKGTITEKEADLVRCTLWDMIPYSDFLTGRCDVKYRNRFLKLEDCVQSFVSKKLFMVISYNVFDAYEASQLFEQYLAEGQEGVILKDMNSPWEDKRVKHQIKYKGELECDLRCVGWEEGTGKNVGRLGALVLQSEDGIVKVSVGTGFTDEMRNNITEESVVDKIVAIKYNAKIIDKKTGVNSLFLPVFIEIRDDKDIADSSNSIK